MRQYKLALQSLRAVPDKDRCSGRNDFTPAAIGAALYCVRMASLEILAGHRSFWREALELYRQDHWHCRRLSNGTLVVY